jgi:hypothetical protein
MTERNSADRDARRRRFFVAAALVAAGALIVAIAITTDVLRLGKPGETSASPEQLAADRCQSEVLKRLVSASTAHVSDIRTETAGLDVDGKDQFPLTLEEPLKGVDQSRITVLNVSGVVNAPTEVGTTLKDHFDCRAYFVDGSLVHTLVLFEHEH